MSHILCNPLLIMADYFFATPVFAFPEPSLAFCNG